MANSVGGEHPYSGLSAVFPAWYLRLWISVCQIDTALEHSPGLILVGEIVSPCLSPACSSLFYFPGYFQELIPGLEP